MQVKNSGGTYISFLAFKDIGWELYSNLVRKNLVRPAGEMIQKFQLVKLIECAFFYEPDMAKKLFLITDAVGIAFSHVKVH